jgi:hypothetical protein
MTLADFASLGTTISGLAVTASLIYLALQVHQNTKHTRALILQGRASRVVSIQFAAMQTDIAEAVIAAGGVEPTKENVRKMQFRMMLNTYLNSFEESWSQYRHGLLEDDGYRSLRENIARLFAQPGFRPEWEKRKTPGSEFTKFVDAIISELLSQPYLANAIQDAE